MRKLLALFLLPLFIFGAYGCASSEDGSATTDDTDSKDNFEKYNELAEKFVTSMAEDDFDSAYEMFDGTMKSYITAATLKTDVWDVVVAQAGAFVGIHEITNSVIDDYLVCFTTAKHENRGVTLRVVFSKDGLVAGLFIDGYPTIKDEVTKHAGFTDIPVTIGEGTDFPLDGILSMPDNAESVPAVVLVHGSGPQDMDETIFVNKPFRDIAEYLASNGIAVLRYDKRTFAHGAKFVEKFGGSATVAEETVIDAVLAAQLLKADARIDENRVFILGHSLGGMLAPRIHAEGGNFAGLILLAGTPRSLLDVSHDQQVMYINEMPEGEEKTALLAQMESYDEQMAALMALSDEEAKTVEMSGGVWFYYFKEMDEKPVSGYLEEIEVPMLVLQGSADFQVFADKDFALYKELLGGRDNVTMKLYDGLNHLFMPSSGKKILDYQQEYQVAGNVDKTVLSDITEWIRAN